MGLRKLLVANRGEIAIWIRRAAAELEIEHVVIFSEDDAESLHVRSGETHALNGGGAAAYLDIDQIVGAPQEHGCDSVHPGYGFLAENAPLAQACASVGLMFVGPSVAALQLFGDKARAPIFAVAWPTSEHGGMNLEASVLLSSRDRLAAIDDVDERAAEYDRLVAAAYVRGSGINVASTFEIDDMIDPATTRRWIADGF